MVIFRWVVPYDYTKGNHEVSQGLVLKELIADQLERCVFGDWRCRLGLLQEDRVTADFILKQQIEHVFVNPFLEFLPAGDIDMTSLIALCLLYNRCTQYKYMKALLN